MRSYRSIPGPALLLASLLFLPPSLSAQDSDEVDTISVLDSVYTEEQAEAGEEVFQAECAACHLPSEFTGPIFEAAWVDRSVFHLFRVTAVTMPQDQPGSLSDEEYAAVIAYILELNEYPAGETELGHEEEELERILIDPQPDSER